MEVSPPPNGLTLRLFLIPVHILRKLGTEVHKVTAATVKTIKTTRNGTPPETGDEVLVFAEPDFKDGELQGYISGNC